MTTKEAPVIVEQIFNVSAKVIWESITELNKMKLWYFENIPDYNPVVGFKTEFNVKSEDRNFLHQWEVTEVVPLKKISYRWNYKDYSGDSFVHFEIFKNSEGVLLQVSTEIIEDFSDEIPEFRRESCVGGWNYFIKERLKNYIENSNK